MDTDQVRLELTPLASAVPEQETPNNWDSLRLRKDLVHLDVTEFPSGRKYLLSAGPDSEVDALKVQIEKSGGPTPDSQRLVYGADVLDDGSRTLSSHGMRQAETYELQLGMQDSKDAAARRDAREERRRREEEAQRLREKRLRMLTNLLCFLGAASPFVALALFLSGVFVPLEDCDPGSDKPCLGAPFDCGAHGNLTSSGECECEPGYRGDYCELDASSGLECCDTYCNSPDEIIYTTRSNQSLPESAYRGRDPGEWGTGMWYPGGEDEMHCNPEEGCCTDGCCTDQTGCWTERCCTDHCSDCCADRRCACYGCRRCWCRACCDFPKCDIRYCCCCRCCSKYADSCCFGKDCCGCAECCWAAGCEQACNHLNATAVEVPKVLVRRVRR